MGFSYFEAYDVCLDYQQILINLETAMFHGKLLQRSSEILEAHATRKETQEYELVNEIQTTSSSEDIHLGAGSKLLAPLWMVKALINVEMQDIMQSKSGTMEMSPRHSHMHAFARVAPSSLYGSASLHELASPALSQKHSLNDFADHNSKSDIGEFFYDIGVYLSFFAAHDTYSQAISDRLHAVYQYRLSYILRGFHSGITASNLSCLREGRIVLAVQRIH